MIGKAHAIVIESPKKPEAKKKQVEQAPDYTASPKKNSHKLTAEVEGRVVTIHMKRLHSRDLDLDM